MAAVVAFPIALPGWESASFFTRSLVDTPEPVDFLALYIPSKPFLSLAEGIVPAIVVFSIALGLALMAIPNKTTLLDALDTIQTALDRVTGFVVGLAPIGVFALMASAAGTLDLALRGRARHFFEAFDEPWKGTGTEGHWGLFTVDRKAKLAMRELYPDLMPEGQTSPRYAEEITPVGHDISIILRSELSDLVQNGSVNPLGPGLTRSDIVSLVEAEGGTALRLVFNGDDWGGVYMIFDEYDAGAASALAMRLRLPGGVARLELKLEGPMTNSRSVNLIPYEDGRDQAGWRTFSVPLAEFSGVDLSRVVILGLWNPADQAEAFVPGEVIVDDIRFE